MELNVVSKRRKNHEYKDCPDNAGSDENASCDGNAFLGMRYAQQTEISQRSAANHESVRASWLEPFKFSFLSDAVSYDDGYDRSHHPVKYEPGRAEIMHVRQIDHLHLVSTPSTCISYQYFYYNATDPIWQRNTVPCAPFYRKPSVILHPKHSFGNLSCLPCPCQETYKVFKNYSYNAFPSGNR